MKVSKLLLYVLATSNGVGLAGSLDKLYTRLDTMGATQTQRDQAKNIIESYYELRDSD